MVHHHHQNVLVVCDAEQLRPQGDCASQVERATHLGIDGLLQPGRRPGAGLHHLPPEIGPLNRDHYLLGDPPGRDEHRA
jgi:hypothetical protein